MTDPWIFLAGCEGRGGLAAAAEAASAGRDPLSVIEAGIRPVEADPAIATVGMGGAPNLLGELEFDAALMRGSDRRSGAVAAVRQVPHPITLARRVLEDLPHEILAGEGATRFAMECGLQAEMRPLEHVRRKWKAWLGRHGLPESPEALRDTALSPACRKSAHPDIARGTTVLIVRDPRGGMAVGTSTSGWAWKYPGRLGDSPICGAGFFADDRHGACACTHTGEMSIRAGSARLLVSLLARGLELEEACRETLRDLGALQGGYLGPLILHAMDREGRTCVMANTLEGTDRRYWLQTGEGVPEDRVPLVPAQGH